MTSGTALLCCVVAFAGSTWTVAAIAQPAVLLEAGNGDLRADLRWLADRGVIDLSTTTWPIPLNAIRQSLATVERHGFARADEEALRRVKALVRRQSGAAYGLLVQSNTGSLPATDFQHQVRARAGGGVYAQYAGGRFAGKLQANALSDPLTASQDGANLEGSYVAANLFGQVLYAGQLNHFWGPGNNSSVVWSNAATPIPGIGLRRGRERPFETRWLSWMGPWSYELFLGEMQNYAAVPGTRVANMRLSMRPTEGLEVGLSRFLQWGGASYRNSLAVLFNPPNYENPNEPDNALGGFDLRYTSRFFGSPITLYGQFVGEDEASFRPYKWFGLVGAELKHPLGDGRAQWHLEAADTMADRFFGARTGKPDIAYNHGIYSDGLYHNRLPIGHYIGGDGKIYSAGVQLVPTASVFDCRYGARVFYGEVNPNSQSINQAFAQRADIVGAEVSASGSHGWIHLRAGLGAIYDRQRDAAEYSALLAMDIQLHRLHARDRRLSWKKRWPVTESGPVSSARSAEKGRGPERRERGRKRGCHSRIRRP